MYAWPEQSLLHKGIESYDSYTVLDKRSFIDQIFQENRVLQDVEIFKKS